MARETECVSIVGSNFLFRYGTGSGSRTHTSFRTPGPRPGATAVPPPRCLRLWCPRQDSNLELDVRSVASSPLDYEGR